MKRFCTFILVVSLSAIFFHTEKILHGRYTRDIIDYDLTIPTKVDIYGNNVAYTLSNYFNAKSQLQPAKKRKIADNLPEIYYSIPISSENYIAKLKPNLKFIAPNLVIEHRKSLEEEDDYESPNYNSLKVHDWKNHCYYTGVLKNIPNSRIAVSICDGLVGHISIGNKRYYIEPLLDHGPNEFGQRTHIVYTRDTITHGRKSSSFCGTIKKWDQVYSNRFKEKKDEKKCFRIANLGKRCDEREQDYYIQTLAVVDKRFMEYHKHGDYEMYLLTVFNMVYDLYQDASIGSSINIVVVRIIYLDKTINDFNIEVTADAEHILKNFCKWQYKINPNDNFNPIHHDIAILVTRYDLCGDNLTNCELLGMSFMASACTKSENCGVAEDKGLQVGIVIAHEIGHILGSAHDTLEDSGCDSMADDNSFFIMAPFIHITTKLWSKCSRNFFAAFLSTELGDCLRNVPDASVHPFPEILPGVVYNANFQCDLTFSGSSYCRTSRMCQKLYCRINKKTCITNTEPPADGTKCDENKWCYDRKCIPMGVRPKAINGGWSPWGEWSPCNRICGGGVSYAERKCNKPPPANHGRYCLGPRKKYRVCATNLCSGNSITKSFRAEQCASFNLKPFRGSRHKWKPYFVADDPCALYCKPEKGAYVKLSPWALDGTPCKPGTRNMCIDGMCRKVGCDWKLDSDAVEDECGICNGDGTGCTIKTFIFDDVPEKGYVRIATIPKNSRQILVEELKPSPNTIAIASFDGTTFFLNGKFIENRDGEYDVYGSPAVYSHPEMDRETFFLPGPLREDIAVYIVFYLAENVGYVLKYADPTVNLFYKPQYHWEFVEWEKCTARCDVGVQISFPKCVEERHGRTSAYYCSHLRQPVPLTRKCNEQPCRTMWQVGEWGRCSGCYEKAGFRIRTVTCVKESRKENEEPIIVDDRHCKNKKPETHQVCFNDRIMCKKNKKKDASTSFDLILHELWQKVKRSQHEIAKRKNVIVEEGTIYKDNLSRNQGKIVEVPLNKSHVEIMLSDEAFEKEGGKMYDKIDPRVRKVYTGKHAYNRKHYHATHMNFTNHEIPMDT